MSRFPDTQLLDQAIAWHIRLENADADAWGEFAEWLECDPAHNEVYEFVADEDERLAPLLRQAEFETRGEATARRAENDHTANASSPTLAVFAGRTLAHPWRWGALAASIAVAVLIGIQLLVAGASTYSIETAPGEMRTVALSDGSEIALNGDTRIVLDRNDERTANLVSGEARFSVKHDDRDPFTVVAGKRRLVDIGTVFNVVRSPQRFHVAVAKGAVRFEGISRKIDLKSGDALTAAPDGSVQTYTQPTASIGSWADGVLVYDQTPLRVVGDDLSRSLGVTLSIPAGLDAQPFSGVIQTDGGQAVVRKRLEQLLGVTIEAQGSDWTVQP